MSSNDAAVVAQARAGDGEAFRLLVERHSRSVFRLAFRMTNNEADAEEVVQETFLRVHRRLNGFEERANFTTWLYRIAANCSYDLVRKRRRHEDHREAEPDDAQEQTVVESLPAETPAPDRLHFSGEISREVARAMLRLSATERAAFTLRHFEGLSIEEIGKALGLKSNATKNSIFRAVQKLREDLGPLVSRMPRGDTAKA